MLVNSDKNENLFSNVVRRECRNEAQFVPRKSRQPCLGDVSWPELPERSSNSKGARERKVKKFTHSVRNESNQILKENGKCSEVRKKSEKLSVNTEGVTDIQQSQEKFSTKFEKKSSREPKEGDGNNLVKQISEKTEKEETADGLEPRSRRRKQLLKEEKKRIKEEEKRRNMVAPKGQKIRVVNQKMLEVLLDDNVSFVNRQAVIPALNEADFPPVESAMKLRVKCNESSIEELTKNVPATKRIRKRKDPIYVDLVHLIKKKTKRPQNAARRIQKRDGLTNAYSGNQLDASNPELKRGKIKEFPKKKKPSALKCAILEERALRRRLKAITNAVGNLSIEEKIEPVCLPIHSRKFREYCENCLTPRLNDAMKLLLRDIVRFQDRQHQKNPVKAFSKRRYVSGFREVKKQFGLKKVKLVIIAPDLEVAKNKGGIDEIVAELKAAAKEQEVMCAFCLSRRELGYITYKKVPISCIAVLNYEGSENNYQEVLAALAEAQESYQLETSLRTENSSDVTNEVIASLLSKLSESESALPDSSESESPFLSALETKSDSKDERNSQKSQEAISGE